MKFAVAIFCGFFHLMPITKITDKRRFGDWGEEQASFFLIKNGYQIIRRNYRVRQGEIEVIARQTNEKEGKALCSIEVKTRRSADGSAERAVDYGKLNKMFFAARHYCLADKIKIDKTPIRFEQVSVYHNKESGEAEIKKYVIPVD